MPSNKKRFRYEWVVLSVTTIGALIATIQSSALMIALPDMMSQLNMSILTIMWVLLAYMLVLAAMVPLFGRLADMFGRKKFFLLGFVVFTIGSLLCGLSQPGFQGADLIIYRIVQALGGALLLANSIPLIADAFDTRHLGLGLGVNNVAVGAGIVLGPVVGGLLTPIGWQWIFLSNVPIGIIGTIWAYLQLREPVRVPKGQSFDWWGSMTFILGMGLFLLAISLYAFPMTGTDVIVLLFIAGLGGILLFLWIETKVSSPMLDLHMFRNRHFSIGNFTNLLNAMARGATVFLLIFFLQGPYAMDPLTAGLAMVPYGLSFIAAGLVAGHAADRFGANIPTMTGLVINAIGVLGLAFIDHATALWITIALSMFLGLGGGLFSSPNIKMVVSTVAMEKRGIAAGTRTMLQNVGSMLSMAIGMPLALANIPQEDMMKLFLYGGGISSTALTTFESGFHNAFLFFFLTAVVAIIAAFIEIRPRSLKAKASS